MTPVAHSDSLADHSYCHRAHLRVALLVTDQQRHIARARRHDPLPSDIAIFPEPRKFFWLPLDGARHAVGIHERDTNNGELIGTLCRKRLQRAPAGDAEWLWPTCPDCWDTTTAQVGVQSRRRTSR
ncbi:MAG: zinc finger protein [Pseudonocardiaceae bacterium]